MTTTQRLENKSHGHIVLMSWDFTNASKRIVLFFSWLSPSCCWIMQLK
ncbi:hypothetical protein Hanom_Chr11g01043151 [Helianthus anomalus]